MQWYGGVLVMTEYDVADAGTADSRLDFDEPVVDCSQRIFQITTGMMWARERLALTVFPSRRWRNMRTGDHIEGTPSEEQPLLYLGNPICLFSDPGEGLSVESTPEFRIKSGVELGY